MGIILYRPASCWPSSLSLFIDFLQKDVTPESRKNKGLQYVFKAFFPIKSLMGDCTIDFVQYSVGEPRNSPEKCRLKKLTYEVTVSALFRVAVYKDGKVADVREQNLPIFDLPMMTPDGSFVVNGVEKVVLSQIVRAPGVVFSKSKEKQYSARILPDFGAWLKFEFGKNDQLFSRIDTSAPIMLANLFRAFGAQDEDIIPYFPDMRFEEFTPGPEVEDLYRKHIKSHPNDATPLPFLAGRLDILRKIKKNVVPTVFAADYFFNRLFYSKARYDLSAAGRAGINKRTGLTIPEAATFLDKEDLMSVAQKVIECKNTEADADNIDSLENKIIKPVGRQLTEYVRDGFLAMEKHILETFHQSDPFKVMPSHLIKTTVYQHSRYKVF